MPALSYPVMAGRSDSGFVASLTPRSEPQALGEVTRDTLTYIHYDGTGLYVGAIARLPGLSSFATEAENRAGRQIRSEARVPFAPIPVRDLQGGQFYYGSGDRHEIRVLDLRGSLQRIIRRVERRRPLTSSVITRYQDDRRARSLAAGAPRGLIDRALDQEPIPDSLPAYDRLKVDRLGAIWVRDHLAPGVESADWHIYDSDGTWVTTVTVPSRFELLDIGRDYVLVLARDELDVERIHLYDLEGRS